MKWSRGKASANVCVGPGPKVNRQAGKAACRPAPIRVLLPTPVTRIAVTITIFMVSGESGGSDKFIFHSLGEF